MQEMKVGGKFELLAGRPEGTFFEITESGPIWIFYYDDPTDKEIAAISEGSPFEIRSMVRGGVLWVFVRCGGEAWAEAPYSPHLSRSAQLPPVPDGTAGYALTLVMVDRGTQTIRHMRLIGLGNRFSRQLYADVRALADAPFDRQAYDAAVIRAQSFSSTDQLVAMCPNYWRLR